MVYEKLCLALPEEDQILYKQRVDELSPSLRYCAYNIGDESAINDLLEMRNQGHGELLDKLDVSNKYFFLIKCIILFFFWILDIFTFLKVSQNIIMVPFKTCFRTFTVKSLNNIMTCAV